MDVHRSQTIQLLLRVVKKSFNGAGMYFGCYGKDANSHTGIEPITGQGSTTTTQPSRPTVIEI